MKKYMVIGLFLLMSNAIAENQHEVEAERLLELSGTRAAMITMTDIMLTQQLNQNPELAPFESVIRKFFQKHLSYEVLKYELISLYVRAFTKEELIAINNFYSTDVGKKVVRLMPVLMRAGGDIGVKKVQDNMGELEAMIQKEANRLKALNDK